MSTNVVAFPVEKEPEPQGGPVRLYLGANQNPLPGYVNVDIEAYPGIDVVTDLEKRWPWDDATADEIYTADLPEHLRVWYEEPDPSSISVARTCLYNNDTTEAVRQLLYAIEHPKRTYGIIHFFNECWRVLKPGGILRFKIPTTENSKAWAQDPTHVSYWNENTFLYFIKNGYAGIYPREIQARFEPLDIRTLLPNTKGESWVVGTLRKPL